MKYSKIYHILPDNNIQVAPNLIKTGKSNATTEIAIIPLPSGHISCQTSPHLLKGSSPNLSELINF